MRVAQRSQAAGGTPAAGRGAQDLSAVAMFTVGLDGRVSSWSAAAGRLLGHQAGQVLGQPVSELLDPGSRGGLAGALTAVTAGTTWAGVLTARAADGSGQHVSFRLEPLIGAGPPPQVAVTASPPVPAGQQLLLDAGLRFGATLDVTETARQIVGVTVPRFADACAVYLLERLTPGGGPAGGEAGREAVARRLASGAAPSAGPAAARALPAGEVLVLTGGTPGARCVAASSPVVFSGPDGTAVTGPAGPPDRAGIPPGHASFLAVPLVARDMVTGFMVLARVAGPGPFSPHEIGLADELAERAAVCLDNAQRFSRQRRTAEAVQRGLLPGEPTVPAGMEVAQSYLPAADHIIGGDWYDILPLSAGRTALIVGDAMGHGPEAATVMVQLRAGAHALADAGLKPEMLLHRLNKMAATLKEPAFATCVCAIFDPATRSCVIARAGHLPPVLALPDHTSRVVDVPPGLPLGLGPTTFHAVRLTLPPRSTLALYTDGLVESRRRPFDEGILALRAALAASSGPLQASCDAITRSLCRYAEDDTTLILARIPDRPGA
jgi:PAS domain S-box-containing protein